jgi:hypothetical protein
VLGVEIMRLEPTTPCLPSQFERGLDLGNHGSPQVDATVVLSVRVRWGPVMTAVNGTLVARPVRTTLVQPAALASS